MTRTAPKKNPTENANIAELDKRHTARFLNSRQVDERVVGAVQRVP